VIFRLCQDGARQTDAFLNLLEKSTDMFVKEIVAVGIFALAFILWFFFIIKLDPKKKLKGTPKFLRILNLTLGVIFLALMWFGALDKSIFVKIILSILAIGFVYNNLNGWLLKVKEKETKSM
jgi:hypothetical protein